MHILFLSLFLLGSLTSPSPSPDAQSTVEIRNAPVTYHFGEQVHFQASFFSHTPIQAVHLFIQPEGQTTHLEPVTLNQRGEISFVYNARENPLRPFAPITYWYKVTLADGSQVDSPPYEFEYIDNRFDWQTLDGDLFKVYWYEGDLAFGQEVMNTAEAGLRSAQNLLNEVPSVNLKVFVYANTTDLQQSLQLAQKPWVAGHASPDLGVILVSIPSGPEQRLEMERQIPHEQMHVLQYQMLGDGYRNLPVWLSEGMASLAERYPNPEYSRALNNAVQSQSLLPIQSLCEAFPQESEPAFLAYAESASFVQYLHQKYGTTRLQELMHRYQDGQGCEEAIDASLGISLTQLENLWHQEVFGMNPAAQAFRNLSPYWLLLLLVLLPPAITIYLSWRKARYSRPKGGNSL
jgi:hypothetical protein